jgi:hypothetical protein
MSKLFVLQEFWDLLRYNKKYWMLPILLVLLLAGFVLVASQGSAIAPFIYALF